MSQFSYKHATFTSFDETLGAVLSPKDVRDYRAVCSTQCAFPNEFKLELVRVKNQGTVGSCVAHALSEVVEYFNKKQLNMDIEMSTGYIYGNRQNTLHKGSGMVVRDALAALSKYGTVQKIDFPENVEVPEAIELFQERLYDFLEVGHPYRISTYARLKTAEDVKQALMKNGPVVIAMDWYSDMKVKNGLLISSFDKNKKSGGHCMVIYGWDTRGWKVQNSWGRWWGTQGKCVIPYSVNIREFWAVTDDVIEGMDIKKPFSSEFGMQIAKLLNLFWSFIHKLTNK